MTSTKRLRLLRWSICAAAVLLAVTLAGACSSTADVTDDAGPECVNVCSRFRECESPTYDVTSCEARCADNIDTQIGFDQTLLDCNQCLAGRACDGAFDACGECAAVVL